MRAFYALWASQGLSALGSAMTSYALVVWCYQQQGSALNTALLSVCSYAPYVLVSLFAGALSDRWDKRRTMIFCDVLAALSTLCVLALMLCGRLKVSHLYLINALNGLMNTFQQPAGEVAVSLLTPHKQIQRVSSLQALTHPLVALGSPALASALMLTGGIQWVIAFDLFTCAAAVGVLIFFIRLPRSPHPDGAREPVLRSAAHGLSWLRTHRGILDLMLFLAAINFTASAFNAILPARILPVAKGGEAALGLVNSCSGLAMLAGGVYTALCPRPQSRVRVIMATLTLSMTTENLILSVCHTPVLWCAGSVLGWVGIAAMNANLSAIYREHIPLDMQGRVYAARNALQFFTIPLGYLAGGAAVDRWFEPWMAMAAPGGLAARLFGSGKGSGAALALMVLFVLGALTCLVFRCDRHIRALEE